MAAVALAVVVSQVHPAMVALNLVLLNRQNQLPQTEGIKIITDGEIRKTLR